MTTDIKLPLWLDTLIYEKLGAKYCRSNADITVIDWDRNDVLNYLGTYFPRSYAESYCIFSDFFKLYPDRFAEKEEISILDFGCGTGGEILGLLTALSKYYPNLRTIKVVALDGNQYALQLYDTVLLEFKKHIALMIDNNSTHICIDDFYDLSILNKVLKRKFDIAMSFKAICEFVTKQQFEQNNAYEHIVKFLLPKLSNNGIVLLVDVTTYNSTSQDWLPKMMDRGLIKAQCNIIKKNEGFNQLFRITHSHKTKDESKIAWRIITK